MTHATTALAEWAVGFRLEHAPPSVREAAKKALLNSMATAMGAADIDHTRRALLMVRSDGQAGPAHVLVTGDALPPAAAAFVNGVMVNALGQEETHIPSGTHPSETTAPIALAEAEAVGATGRELLEAFIVGMQVSGAVGGMSLVWRNRELLAQPPSAYGSIGAAAAAARLRQLDVDQTGRALGLAAMFTAAPAESMRAGTGEYHYLKGLAAMHAHAAVMLAACGAGVAPTALEGAAGFYRIWANIAVAELESKDIAGELRQRVAEEWVAPELSYKRYPVNYFNQPFIDAARALRERHSIDPGEVQAIRLRVGAHPAKVGALGGPPFDRRAAAMMSTRFGVACMLARGRVTLADTLEPGGDDIRCLADLSDAEADPHDDRVVGVRIVTARGAFGGDMLPEFSDYRLTADEIRRISEPLISARIGEACPKLIDQLDNVEAVGSVSDLVEATVPGRDASRQPARRVPVNR